VATVVILGAGEIGGAAAREIAALDLVSRIVIVDDLAAVAAGKALDIAQSAPVDRYHTALSGTSDVAAVVGAAAIMIADGWPDEAGLALARRIGGLNQSAPILCAGAGHERLVDRAVNEAGLSRLRVFGSAPEALRSAVIAITAAEANAAPSDISLTVLGRPPQHVIVPWDEASIGGRSAANALSAAQLARLDARVARLWPPGPYALAAAAAGMLRTALTQSPRQHSALVAVRGPHDADLAPWGGITRDERMAGRSAMMPVTLNSKGIAALVPPSLSTRDRVRFETAIRA
jgi:malate/lactate dehydrogenase